MSSIRTELLAHDNAKVGLAKQIPIDQLFRIEKVAIFLEGKGKQPSTIDSFRRHIAVLARNASLDNPQEVELAIARLKKTDPSTKKLTNNPVSNTYKAKLCFTYQHYTKFYKMFWEVPHYIEEERSIQPPSDEKCQMLIASARGALSLMIDISVQTGLRPIEVQGYKGLRVRDIHTEQRTITALSTKGCNARPPMPISEELTAKLKTYIEKHNLQGGDFLFRGDSKRYGEHFRRMRNRLADKLNDPTIRNIRLYDLRHHYVTKKLRKMQNAEFVRQIVGHKRLDTTQKYFHLLANTNGEWIVEGTTDKERAEQLLASDFIYQLTTPDGTMLFKKPK
jgi:site-specific recombinase XerD